MIRNADAASREVDLPSARIVWELLRSRSRTIGTVFGTMHIRWVRRHQPVTNANGERVTLKAMLQLDESFGWEGERYDIYGSVHASSGDCEWLQVSRQVDEYHFEAAGVQDGLWLSVEREVVCAVGAFWASSAGEEFRAEACAAAAAASYLELVRFDPAGVLSENALLDDLANEAEPILPVLLEDQRTWGFAMTQLVPRLRR